MINFAKILLEYSSIYIIKIIKMYINNNIYIYIYAYIVRKFFNTFYLIY